MMGDSSSIALSETVSWKASSVEGAAATDSGHVKADRNLTTDYDEQKEHAADSGNDARNDFESEAVVTETEKSTGVEQRTEEFVTDGNGEQKIAEAATEANEDEEDEANMVFPGGLQLTLLTFGLCMATFVVALDNTIIATAIPQITTVFNSLDDVGWYGSSYLLTTTALQPSFGRIYTYFNVKYTYIFALVLFEVGSVLCAAANGSTMLIVGRAVAGSGASGIFSGGMTIVGMIVPLRKRSMYIAAVSSMFGVSSVVGPLLGGVFTDKVTWRWCFWINLPIGAIAIVAVWSFFKPPKRRANNFTLKQKILEIDLLGAFVLTCAIICLLLALQWGGFKYSWKDSKIWGCLLGFGLLITVFIVLQIRRGDRATIPPRIFLQKTILWSSLYSCFLNMATYSHMFYVPFYFQAVKGTTAIDSGIRTIPYLVSIILASIIVGIGIMVIGIYKPFMIIGAGIFIIGAGMIYTLAIESPARTWIGYQILAGFGAGAGIQVPFVAIQVVLKKRDMPSGNAIALFFNSLGGAISISMAQNIFVNGLVSNIPVYAPTVNPQLIINAGATHIREVVSAADLGGVLEAYMKSLNETFILPIVVGGIAFGVAFFVESRSVKGRKLTPAAAA